MRIQFTTALAGAIFCSTLSAGLIITPQFDASINSDPNAAAIKATINGAISVYENTFLNPINVDIYFQEGGGLGQSDIRAVYGVGYQVFYDQLVATNANPAAIAGLDANGGNGDANGGFDPVLGNNSVLIKSANARALGFNAAGLCHVAAGDTIPGTGVPNHCAAAGANIVDGIISLNTSITTPPGDADQYSLLAVVEHEIDEILGLGSALPGTDAPNSNQSVTNSRIFPEDLWRFDGTGNRAFTIGHCNSAGRATFSLDGTTNLTDFNNACNGGDFGDWKGDAIRQVQDAFGSAGSTPTLGTNELQALSAVGYQVGTPEPTTMLLMFGGMAVCAGLRRFRS